MKHIVGEVQIISRKCSSDIILFLIPALCKFLEFRHDQIITSLSVSKRTHLIIDFFSSVQTEYDIIHLFIDKLLDLIIQKNAVCRYRETEMFIMKLLLLPSISDKIFYNLPVHKRFATEEINFKISSLTGIGNQKIKRLFPNFIWHQCPASMILAFLCETISACQIAVMCDMKTKRFNNCFSFLYFIDIIFVNIFCEKSSFFCKRYNSFQDILYIFFWITTFKLWF